MSINCDTRTNICQTQASANQDCCPVEKSINQDCCCPVEAAAAMWKKAFFCAMKETQVDILKEKIRKTWGPMMDKVADATVKAMGIHWESMLAQANAKKGLHENIANIYQSAP
ncbi:MAG: hypothetical protein HZA01_13055 [Nitrospinae bacterium]|nr:hypothetical protein [Nitrospinota bacterium]